MKLTISEVVKRMKRHKPKNAKACIALCKLNLVHVGSGCAREVYRVGNLPVVIKFSKEMIDRRSQAWKEHCAYQKIMRSPSLSKLRTLMPRIYYYSYKTGNAVVRYYQPASCEATDKVHKCVHKALKNTKALLYAGDLHQDNTGMTKCGRPKIIDLGLFR